MPNTMVKSEMLSLSVSLAKKEGSVSIFLRFIDDDIEIGMTKVLSACILEPGKITTTPF